MADIRSNAILRDTAVQRMTDSIQVICTKLEIEAPVLVLRGRDPAYAQAQLLDTMAGLLENIAGALEVHVFGETLSNDGVTPEENSEGYEAMTVAHLRELAEARGVDLAGLRLKGEIIDALQAADDMTEAEQAAQDGVDFEDEQPEMPESEGEEAATAEETTPAGEDEPPDDPAGE